MKSILKSLGAFTLLATSSQAAVMFSGPQNLPIPTDFTGVFIDITSFTTLTSDDSTFTNSDINFFFGGSGIANGPGLQPVREGTDNLDFLVNLPFGSSVDSSSTFSSGFGGSENGHIGEEADQIGIGEVGFFGFSLEDNGETHFGYLRVKGGNAETPGEVLDWAYESTPNQAITVVPEPSSLALIGLGSLCLLLRRKIN